MISPYKNERPLGMQLLGCEEKFIQKAIEVINEYEFDILDFNAACPAKKVVRRGEGASLLRDPGKLSRILKMAVEIAKVPVTVKIRSGWDNDSVNARRHQVVRMRSGFIHGRPGPGHSHAVDYDIIRQVKKAIKIPMTAMARSRPAACKKMFDETSRCVIVARER
jgi:tRNA-dihydrouridine synthase B